MDPLIGQVLVDRFRVVRMLGVGGMGKVYEVEHTQLPKRFAIKVLGSRLAREKEALQRFRREAEIVAGLQHPHIVEIVDWATLPDGRPFYVMELLDGSDLEERMRKGPLSWPEIRTLATQSFSALGEAHRQGIYHRDLKPTNIFLREVGSGLYVKLIDFGLARAKDMAAITVYTSPKLIGTPAFMSPEQIKGQGPVGEEADTWAMAAVLYAAAAGKAPFRGSFDVLVAQIGKRRPVPLRTLRADAPIAFADALAAALSPDPDRRIRRLDELGAKVEEALDLETLSADLPDMPPEDSAAEDSGSAIATRLERPSPERISPPTRAKTNRRALMIALGLGTCLLLGLGAFVLGGQEESTPSSSAPIADASSESPTQASDAMRAEAPVETVEVRVDTSPPGARLFIDMVHAGEDGATFSGESGTELWVTCHQAGFRGGEVKLVFDGSRDRYRCKLSRKGGKTQKRESKRTKSDKKGPKRTKGKIGDDLAEPSILLPDF